MSFGFASDPLPNPSSTTVQFQIQLLAQGTAKVCVGLTNILMNNCNVDPGIEFNHAISIPAPQGPELQAYTDYFALVTGYDQSNNLIAQSDPIPFTTLPATTPGIFVYSDQYQNNRAIGFWGTGSS